VLPTLVLVASLAAGAAPADLAPRPPGELALRAPALGPRRALRQEDESDEPQEDDEDRPRKHLLVSGWGGEALAHGGSGRASSFYGGEVAWAFSELDVGLAFSEYRALRDARRAWTPVVLTRVTQRFLTRRGFEAAFSLGFGAGKPSGWIGWYQVALGGRVPLGPFFVGAELAFEQYDIIRLGGGLGVTF
jgi:hypothetical protein